MSSHAGTGTHCTERAIRTPIAVHRFPCKTPSMEGVGARQQSQPVASLEVTAADGTEDGGPPKCLARQSLFDLTWFASADMFAAPRCEHHLFVNVGRKRQLEVRCQ